MRPLYLSAALLVCCACMGCRAEMVWLDRTGMVMKDGESERVIFTAPAFGDSEKPLLWIAAHIEWVREEVLWPALAVEVNGTRLNRDRLIGQEPVFHLPGVLEWPPRAFDKCLEFESRPLWFVRFDDDGVLGNDPKDERHRIPLWRRFGSITEDFAPSYAFDLSGLVKPGQNELIVRYMIVPGSTPPPANDFPTPPKRSYLALNVEFMRVGFLSQTEIDSYNRAHTEFPAFSPRSFNLLDSAGLDQMRKHYSRAAVAAVLPEDKAFCHVTLASAVRWKALNVEAEAEFRQALDADPRGHFAPMALFMLGLARSEANDLAAATGTWNRLAAGFPNASWTEIARREAALAAPGAIARITNWPVLRAKRTADPPPLDGRMDAGVWQQARAADTFSLYPTKYQRFPFRTEVRFLYDDQNLYVGAVCLEPAMDEVTNPHLIRDTAVWDDDCMEFFLDPGRSYASVYEFEAGVNGGVVDVLNVGNVSYMEYNPPTVTRSARFADRWTIEVAIPWQSFATGKPGPGDIWLFNAARNRPRTAHREPMMGTLGPATDMFRASEAAVFLLFE